MSISNSLGPLLSTFIIYSKQNTSKQQIKTENHSLYIYAEDDDQQTDDACKPQMKKVSVLHKYDNDGYNKK